ncbi:MAG: hypothetical protein A2Y38_17545 [Spirochaetes bacterium GWB1_59_5]|nr:MAG: hypothetical protein A2Y38_17545 [Spirochaetes bacterium GWB1_59_5]
MFFNGFLIGYHVPGKLLHKVDIMLMRANSYYMGKRLPLAVACIVSISSCAILRAADYATEAFMREGDPELAKAALPTMMKASEAILLANPANGEQALALASLYVMYASAFLDGEAFLLPDDAWEQKRGLSIRAKALYLRAADLLVPLVEAKIPGVFEMGLGERIGMQQEENIAAHLKRKDVPLLYWTSAAILAAFASDPMDFDNAGRISGALTLFEQARGIAPDWNAGSLHELAITVYGSLPADLGGDRGKATAAFILARAETGTNSPGPYLAYALSVCVAAADRDGFRTALETAISLKNRPETALLDSLARRKARRLLDDISLYF